MKRNTTRNEKKKKRKYEEKIMKKKRRIKTYRIPLQYNTTYLFNYTNIHTIPLYTLYHYT